MMYGNECMQYLFFTNTNNNEELVRRNNFKLLNNYFEVIKFQGVMQLCTRYEFPDRDKLWSRLLQVITSTLTHPILVNKWLGLIQRKILC